jgi:exodeoxyribonuclease V alpha subunit
MSEALRQRAAHLPASVRSAFPSESFTIHRLLGPLPDGDFEHNAGNPLALDALVVDEASMLDLALATKLMDAVPHGARIVLLGDKDQLCAVESGAVFAELSADPTLSAPCKARLAALCNTPAANIIEAAPILRSPLADTVVWFNRNFRFAGDSGIGRLAADIVAGRAGAVLSWLANDPDPSVRWLDEGNPQPSPLVALEIESGFTSYLQACRLEPQAEGTLQTLHQAFARFRVLCATRDGPRGVHAANAHVSQWLRRGLSANNDPDARSPWFTGRPVMVLRNDQALKLYNGDIGIARREPNGLWEVWFPAPEGGFRAIPAVRLPPHQTAFAMTVHKSQGSEFDSVLVMMPAQPGRVLNRELLYTAVTRARTQVTLVASAPVLRGAIHTTTRRHSGLLARMAEVALVE